MVIKKSKLISVILSIMLILTMLPFLPGGKAFAAAELKLNKTSITIDDKDYDVWGDDLVETEPGSAAITGVKSSNTSVVTVSTPRSYSNNGRLVYYFYVTPISVGNAILTVTGENAASKTIPVTITENWEKDKLKERIHLGYNWYGTKKIEIMTYVKGSGKLKVGSDTYKFTTDGVNYSKIIKMKKRYAPKTKITLTFTDTNGTKITKYDKITKSTYIVEINASKKAIKVTVYNAHKYDRVTVKYKSKTYTKKVSKDKDQKVTTLTFKVKKTVTSSASMKIKILTSKKKSLMGYTSYKLSNYHWDEDIDDYDDYDDY